jgi:hypothetical protein
MGKVAVSFARIDSLEELADIDHISEFEHLPLLGVQSKAKQNSIQIIFQGVTEEKTVAGEIFEKGLLDSLIFLEAINDKYFFL